MLQQVLQRRRSATIVHYTSSLTSQCVHPLYRPPTLAGPSTGRTHTVISREDVCAQVCYTKGISWDTIATPEQVREFDITDHHSDRGWAPVQL